MECADYCYEKYFQGQIMKNWPVMFYAHLKESILQSKTFD